MEQPKREIDPERLKQVLENQRRIREITPHFTKHPGSKQRVDSDERKASQKRAKASRKANRK